MSRRLVVTTLAGILLPCVLLAQASQSKPTASAQSPLPLKELGDLIVGRWMSEVTWATDYPGLGKKGEKVTGFDAWRWTADGAALECDWLLGATSGRTIVWWDASAKQLRAHEIDSGANWAQGTITKQGTAWLYARAGAFADGRHVEYQSQISFLDGGKTRFDAGATSLGGARNEFRDVYRRVVM